MSKTNQSTDAEQQQQQPNTMLRRCKRVIFVFVVLFLAGFVVPEKPTIPVQGASVSDWNSRSFWHYPWGRSIVHKGIDIFAKKGTPLLASTHGVVIKTGHNSMGGNYIVLLGSGWRVHYYAHVETTTGKIGRFYKAGSVIGSVGDSGNAKGKQPHVHWSIRRLIPLPWHADDGRQGSKKAYFINPHTWLGFEEPKP